MNKKVAFFLPPLGNGGVERTVLKLADILARNDYEVDIVTVKAQGPFLKKIHNGVRIIDFGAGRTLASFPGLVSYLRRNQPTTLISAQYYANVIAIWAKFLARVSTRVIVTERLALSLVFRESRKWKDKILSFLMRFSYPKADAIVTVSKGAAKDLARITGIKEDSIRVIYNPTFDGEILRKSSELVDHPWFREKKSPIILGAGRLTNQKDFATLIRAFAEVREEMEAKLIILGEGENRHELEELIKKLGVAEDIDMPGFVENPYKYMARADLFVLSSIYEGMPNVIVEALATGTPVIATDCPSGPKEVLPEEALVAVGDDKSMGKKIIELLQNRKELNKLLNNEKESLEQFRPENSLQRYMELIEQK